ncbi:MAG: hypothetical protein J6S69_06970 [Proteobacteria bacterium]|nr:hypothetical protein [Pseudomonadota bacterium]
MPDSGTCESCLDLDGDGQGFGDCPVPGYDCDPGNPDIYYTTDLPKVCTHDVTDTNCNGKIDTFELLGSNEHCRFCNDVCSASSTALNMTRHCELISGKEIDDYAFSSFNASDENTYLTQCSDTCADGWGDCNRDYQDGCEVNLIDRDNDKYGGVKYSHDDDKDGYGKIDDSGYSYVYCCGYDTSNCYAYQNSLYIQQDILQGNWERPDNDVWMNVQNGSEWISPDLADCNDDSEFSYVGNAEICDGQNNTCDNKYQDGSDDIYIDNRNSHEIKLGGECNVYNNQGSVCAKGKVGCIKGNNEKYEMKCIAEIAQKEGEEPEGDKQLCDGIDNNCNGEVDESYEPSFTSLSQNNKDGSIDICKYRITQCLNGSVYDKDGGLQVFTKRDYDFYGDGIDSNCDGYDFDVSKAIFIAQGGEGAENGSDSNSGLMNNPVKSLQKALDLACPETNSNYFCQDILVMKSAAEDSTKSSEPGNWASKGSIEVRTFSTNHNLYASHERLSVIISDDSSKENKNTVAVDTHLKEYSCTANGCMNNYLLPDELVPPEAVRIYGGFESFEDLKRSDNTTTVYSYQYDPDKKSDHMFALVAGNGEYPLSLKLDSVPLILNSKPIPGTEKQDDKTVSINADLQNGLMLVGLTCGKKGCRHLTLNKSSITVTGNTGRNNSEMPHESNIWKKEHMQGIQGQSFYSDWSNYKENWTGFETNRKQNTMFYDYYSKADRRWSSVPSSTYNSVKCPDGSSPRGGAPASWCCRGQCGPDYAKSKNGENGTGSGHGGDGLELSISGSGCNESDWYEGKGAVNTYERYKNGSGTYVMGANGGHGDGGAGGKNQDVACTKNYLTDGFYVNCDTSKANGKPGQAGGGGGGGAIHQCFRHKNYGNPAWIHGGGGGAGGCGGYGGMAGGMGISATGLILNPPASTSNKFSYHNLGSQVSANAGSGGSAQAGQTGVYGGWRGDGFGYGKEGLANVDMHCHRATAGGVGGTGGGGGAGANGVSGEAFGVVFIDKNKINVNTDKSTLESYGYEYTDSLAALLADPGKAGVTVSTQNNGGNGGAGKSGMNPTNHEFAGTAVLSSNGGQAANGTSMETKGHSKTIEFLQNSSF